MPLMESAIASVCLVLILGFWLMAHLLERIADRLLEIQKATTLMAKRPDNLSPSGAAIR